MADKQITDLTSGGAPQAGDQVHAVRSGNSRRIALGTAAGAAATDFATASQGTKADGAAQKSANLSDLSSAATAFANIKQAASTSATGVVELATASEYRAGTDSTRALITSEVWSAADWFALTDGATITINMALFLSLASVALGGNRSFGTPSNAKPGQHFIFKVTATTSTRTLTLPSAFVLATGVEAGPYSITTTETLFICGFVDSTSVLRVTAVLRF